MVPLILIVYMASLPVERAREGFYDGANGRPRHQCRTTGAANASFEHLGGALDQCGRIPSTGSIFIHGLNRAQLLANASRDAMHSVAQAPLDVVARNIHPSSELMVAAAQRHKIPSTGARSTCEGGHKAAACG